MTLKET